MTAAAFALIYDGSGRDTCFADNLFASSVPPALEVLSGCG